VVGRALAKKFGWKVGDRVSLESPITRRPEGGWTFTIDGIYTAASRSVDQQTFYFHWARLNESLPADQQNTSADREPTIRPDGAARPAAGSIRIFVERDVQTLSQTSGRSTTGFIA